MSIQSEINRIAGAKSDIADAIEDQGVTVPSGTKLDGMANLIGQISGGSGKLNSTQAADAYDPTATYAVGDKVSYAGNVYSCISAISTPEDWDSTHWDQVDPIQDQVDDVRNTLNQFDQNMAYVESGNTASRNYTKGQFISWKGTLYTVNGSISSGQSFSTGTGGNLDLVAGNSAFGGGLNSLKQSYLDVQNKSSDLHAGTYCYNIGNAACLVIGHLVIAIINSQIMSGTIASGSSFIKGFPSSSQAAYGVGVLATGVACRLRIRNGVLENDGALDVGSNSEWVNATLIYTI